MPTTARQLRIVRDATELVVRTLSAIAPSDERDVLLQRARDSLRTVEGWSIEKPTIKQREEVMKTVLHLHAAAAKLERRRPPE
jgi:hypothetical protein